MNLLLSNEHLAVNAAIASRLAVVLSPERSRACFDAVFRGESGVLQALGLLVDRDHRTRCELVAAARGLGILMDRTIRTELIASLPDLSVDELFNSTSVANTGYRPNGAYSPVEKRNAVLRQDFVRGSAWSSALTGVLALPTACAGSRVGIARAEFEVVQPHINLPSLHDYQTEVQLKLLERLRSGTPQRCMVTLPTGGGKTRVMVDTLLRIKAVESGEGPVLWLAQHEELCEQAVQCFIDVWRSQQRPDNRSLVIQRVWGNIAEDIDVNADVVVGIPESVVPRLRRYSEGDREFFCIVIDEAHNATDSVYDDVLRLGRRAVVVGLTATPATSNDIRTINLVGRFHRDIIVPPSLRVDAIRKLQDRGYLAEVDIEELHTAYRFDGVVSTRGGVEFTAEALRAAGNSAARNLRIIERLEAIRGSESVLCFASSVASARVLAAVLAKSGRSAASIDAETDRAQRAELITSFKRGQLQFLFNFGVLTTGFDAPKVDVVVMARPTLSPVLLEQMLGRGLRGPKNGGTERCRVIWVLDSMAEHGVQPLGYERFLSSWRR